jgi:hypothetical protein
MVEASRRAVVEGVGGQRSEQKSEEQQAVKQSGCQDVRMVLSQIAAGGGT